ncbi:MAG: hypothetical protein R3D90_01675 [Paracoccaceae bacterium]
MRICVIGNSHAGAIKEGWDRIAPDHPGVAMQFFAAARRGMEGLRRTEGRLIAGNARLERDMALSSGGMTEIDLAAHDLFLLIGLGLRVHPFDQRLSQQVRDAMAAELAQCFAFRLARGIRAGTAAPILVLPAPLHAVPPEGGGKATRARDYDACLSRTEDLAAIEGLRVLGQPVETRPNGWATGPEWSVGSRRLGAVVGAAGKAAHPEGERIHMNADFGAMWLSTILADLAESVAPLR